MTPRCDNHNCKSKEHDRTQCPLPMMCSGCHHRNHPWARCNQVCKNCGAPHHREEYCYDFEPGQSLVPSTRSVNPPPWWPHPKSFQTRLEDIQSGYDSQIGPFKPRVPPNPPLRATYDQRAEEDYELRHLPDKSPSQPTTEQLQPLKRPRMHHSLPPRPPMPAPPPKSPSPAPIPSPPVPVTHAALPSRPRLPSPALVVNVSAAPSIPSRPVAAFEYISWDDDNWNSPALARLAP